MVEGAARGGATVDGGFVGSTVAEFWRGEHWSEILARRHTYWRTELVQSL